MASKGLCTAVIFSFLVSVAIGNKLLPIFDDPHSIYQCPDPTIVEDYPLCASDVKIGGQIFTTLTKTVDCPASGINKKKIACIIVSDLSDNDEGGYATIVNGGLDQYFVEIRLKSQWGKGLNYHIEVYTLSETTTASGTTKHR